MQRRSRWLVILASLSLSGTLFAPAFAVAQEPQFTRQIILIPPFMGERRVGNSAADAVRGRVQKFYNRRVAQVVSEYDMSQVLERSGIQDADIDEATIRTLARHMRADEIIYGRAERLQGTGTNGGNAGYRVSGRLVLVRDARLWQPLPDITAPSLDSAGVLMSQAIEVVRRQLVPLRLCENHLREGRPNEAAAEARRGVQETPVGALVRTCLVNALISARASTEEVLGEAQQILAIHPSSYWALDAGARMHDALGNRDSAASLWLRLIATDTADLKLSKRVIAALIEGKNARSALPVIKKLTSKYGDDLEFWRYRWSADYDVEDWADAVTTGERLLATDSMAQADSTFFLRLASAHKSNNEPIKAIAVAAKGVAKFQNDGRLYLMYSEMIQADGRVAIERGLSKFPEMAELHMLHAQELRRMGKNEEAVEPLRRAMALDPKLGQGYLVMAQAQLELGSIDSTWYYTRKAVDAGDDPQTVAGFALARGNALFRAANGTRQRADYQSAMRFLSLADSLASTPQSQFLVGATALSISQSAATDAPNTRECDLSRLAESMLPIAREKLTAGADVAPDATRQYLAYIEQLEPVVAQQVQVLCTGS